MDENSSYQSADIGMDDPPEPAASLIADLDSVAADIFGRWNSDMRSGKLLTALEGRIERYDPRVTRIRDALAKLDRAAARA